MRTELNTPGLVLPEGPETTGLLPEEQECFPKKKPECLECKLPILYIPREKEKRTRFFIEKSFANFRTCNKERVWKQCPCMDVVSIENLKEETVFRDDKFADFVVSMLGGQGVLGPS